jgi:hypothetical protein
MEHAKAANAVRRNRFQSGEIMFFPTREWFGLSGSATRLLSILNQMAVNLQD